MSQSDYINYKRQTLLLKHIEECDPVLSADTYTQFKGYMLETTVRNTKPLYPSFCLKNQQNIFDMTIQPENCIAVPFCTHTDKRYNRVINKKGSVYIGNEVYPGQTNGYNQYFMYQKVNNSMCVSKEFQDCDEFLYKRKYTDSYGFRKKKSV